MLTSLALVVPGNQLKQPKMVQEMRADIKRKVRTALKKIDKQTKALEDWIRALSSGLNMAMEAKPNDCSVAYKELADILAAIHMIKAKTEEAESRKMRITKRLSDVRSMIGKIMEEAAHYEQAKRERGRARLQEVARQVKTAQDKELPDFLQYHEYKYDQIHGQLHRKRRLSDKGGARISQNI